MPLAEIHFSATQSLWPLFAAFAVLVGFVVWAYGRSAGSTAVRSVCTALKIIGLAALLLCLLEPLWSRPQLRPGANYFVLAADNSASLGIRDAGNTETRGALLKKALIADSTWVQSLVENFQVRRYSIDARLQPVENFAELDFHGSASALLTGLQKIAERHHGQPLAGVLLFTDGNATDAATLPSFAGLPPIYPLVIGRGHALRDVSLQKVAASQTSFEDAPVTVQADVAMVGMANEEIIAQLVDNTGKTVDEQKQRTERADQTLAFRFRLKPQQRGLNFYQVRTIAASERAALTNAAKSTEATLINNTRAVVVDRGRGPYRILYVSGRPNWEFKFLNRALAEDEQVQLIGLIRVAKREPKFEFLGRKGEAVNPLFRGFGQTNEDTERYDQPVLVRLNTRDEFELKGGFPKTAEELYQYPAIVLDDLEAAFFTRDQMTLLQKYVSERGGGVLMLGGAESFREGGYARTPIGDMLPVYLDRAETVKPLEPLKLTLTREGWLQPWVRLRDNEGEERSRIGAMPEFQVVNQAEHIKPGASVLATVGDGKAQTYPALVAERYGHGRTAALLIGDMWRWGMRDAAMHKDMDKAWRQIMRWLVSDVPERFEVRAEQESSADAAGDAVRLRVRSREKNFQPLDNASVKLTVTALAPGGTNSTNIVQLKAEAATEPGLYEATYIPRQAGAYRVEAVIADANGAEVGRAETGWTSDPAAEEFRSLKPNHALLESIAKQTGGEVIALAKLAEFVKSLPSRKVPVTENVALPLWHTPYVFLFALACFVAEWGVRRWKGLP